MKKRYFDFSHFRFDLLGGLTAGIVAMPLGLAFGEQSGLGAVAGLYGSAIIAFFASLFGGTGTQISGPTAPMTAFSMVIIASVFTLYEGRADEAVPVILSIFFLAGIFQMIMGSLRLGQYVKYIPQTVVSGFITGIGVIILVTQILPAVGYYAAQDRDMVTQSLPQAEELLLERILKQESEDGVLVLEELSQTVERSRSITTEEIEMEAKSLASNKAKGVKGTLRHLRPALAQVDLLEVILALITIVIIYLFPKITTKIPSPLVALLTVSLAAYYLELDFAHISSVPAGAPDFKGTDMWSAFSVSSFAPHVLTALMLAFLGSIDSLLTSVVADNLTRTQHDPDRELIGQGVGNSVSALFMGLPGAGATVRTVINIRAGGRTRLSGMIAGAFIFSVILFLGPIASEIPAAVLAGILITVGLGVIDYKALKMLPKMDSADRFILLLVFVLTVFWQLVGAVLVGLVVAAFVFTKRMSDLSVGQSGSDSLQKVIEQARDERWREEKATISKVSEKIYFHEIKGPLFFGVVRDFRRVISTLPDIKLIVIRMEQVPFVDQSGVEGLRNVIIELYDKDVIVAITGLESTVLASLVAMKVIPEILPEEYVFERFDDSSMWLKDIIRDERGLDLELSRLKAIAERMM